jgi:hypothetical protein
VRTFAAYRKLYRSAGSQRADDRQASTPTWIAQTEHLNAFVQGPGIDRKGVHFSAEVFPPAEGVCVWFAFLAKDDDATTAQACAFRILGGIRFAGNEMDYDKLGLDLKRLQALFTDEGRGDVSGREERAQ